MIFMDFAKKLNPINSGPGTLSKILNIGRNSPGVSSGTPDIAPGSPQLTNMLGRPRDTDPVNMPGTPVFQTPEETAPQGPGFDPKIIDKLNSLDRRARPEILDAIRQNAPVLDQFEINTPERQRHFLAQMAHESAGFSALEEFGSGKRYEGRKDLGNVFEGDGARYKGRGIIQLTGRANYQKYGKMLGVDLENNPEIAADPKVALQVAAAYWKDRGLNRLADKNDLRGITKRINGGYNGLADRQRYFDLLQ